MRSFGYCGGTTIKINRSKLFETPEKQVKTVTYTSALNPDKWMICKTFEKHYEILLVDEKQETFSEALKSFTFTNPDEANKKFKEIYSTDTWKKE